MKLLVSTAKVDIIQSQLLNLLGLDAEIIAATPTNYKRTILINIDESATTASSSIRNIKAILLNDTTAAELLQSKTISEASSLKSSDGVDEREQY